MSEEEWKDEAFKLLREKIPDGLMECIAMDLITKGTSAVRVDEDGFVEMIDIEEFKNAN